MEIITLLNYNQNQRNITVDQDYLNQNNPGYTIKVVSDPWKFKSLFLGLQYSIRFAKRFSLGIHAMPGIMLATYPQLIYQINSSQYGPYSVTVHSNDAKSFSYLIGAYFKCALNHAFSIMFKADYIGSKQTFENVRSFGYFNTYYGYPYDKNIQVLNLSLGLGLGIN